MHFKPESWSIPFSEVYKEGRAGTPPPLAVNDLFELRIFCQCADQGSVNVRHYIVDSITGNGPLPGNILGGISASIAGNLKPCLSSDSVYRGCGLRRVLPQPVSNETLSNVGTGAGSSAFVAMAKQVAGLITFTTSYAGRGYRGRIYVPFPSQNAGQADGRPTAAYNGLLGTLGGWLDDVLVVGLAPDTATLLPVLWHKKLGYATQIMGHKVPGKFGTQRKRGDYGRVNESPI